MSIVFVLWLLAFICFVLACMPLNSPVNMVALGLAFAAATHLFGGYLR